MEPCNKVLIIGLDGATWDILVPLIEEGYMPHLKRLIDRGTKGIMQSTIPPISQVAWSSFQTGVNPGKHGIFSFRHFTWDEGNPRMNIVNSSQIRVNTLWDYLSYVGKNSIVINVPMTYPPRPINGVMVSGLLTPSSDSSFTYPKSVKAELVKNIPNYGPPRSTREVNVPRGDIDGFIQNMKKMVEVRGAAGHHLIQRYPWDVFMLQFQVTDYLQHPLWHFLDREHPLFQQSTFDKIATVYQAVDKAISSLLAEVSDGCSAFLISDHGFQRCLRKIDANALLARQNLLFPRDNLVTTGLRFLTRMDFLNLRRKVMDTSVAESAWRRKLASEYDWARSSAFCSYGRPYAGINVLERGNSIDGKKNQTVAILENLKQSKLYGELFDEVLDTHQIYQGPYKTEAPDLILRPNRGISAVCGTGNGDVVTAVEPGKDYQVGIHDEKGIFVSAGPGIRVGELSEEINLVDIFPTVLYRLGIPIPRYIDGRVIRDIFLQAPKLGEDDYVDMEMGSLREKTEVITSREEAEIEERLRDLGYLD